MPSICKGASLAESHLAYINVHDELVSINLSSLGETSTTDKNQEVQSEVFMRFKGALDFCYAGKKKYLYALTKDGIVHKLKFNSGKINLQPLVSINLSNPASEVYSSKSTHYTSIVTGRDELLVSSFDPDTATQAFYLLSQNLELVDKIILKDQGSHVHGLRQVIRNQVSYYIASCRRSNFHIFKVENQSLTACNVDVKLTSGPIDGLCVLNEDEMFGFCGEEQDSFVRRVKFV